MRTSLVRLLAHAALALTLAAGVTFSPDVSAGQTRFVVDEGDDSWSFNVGWVAAGGKEQTARFELPADQISEDLEARIRFRMNEATQESAAAVNAWAKKRKGDTRVTATAQKGGRVSFSAKGTDKADIKAALAEAEAVQQRAMKEYAERHGWHMDDEGNIQPNHAFHAATYADAVAPVVEALGGPTDNPKHFARRALSFVQSIPYDQAPKNRDRFRRPLNLIASNQGDCDSKVVLYLALLRSAYPELPLAVVVMENHAFAAIGLPPNDGDDKLKIDGERWTPAEPVGPAIRPLGTLSKDSAKAAKKGRFEAFVVDRG